LYKKEKNWRENTRKIKLQKSKQLRERWREIHTREKISTANLYASLKKREIFEGFQRLLGF